MCMLYFPLNICILKQIWDWRQQRHRRSEGKFSTLGFPKVNYRQGMGVWPQETRTCFKRMGGLLMEVCTATRQQLSQILKTPLPFFLSCMGFPHNLPSSILSWNKLLLHSSGWPQKLHVPASASPLHLASSERRCLCPPTFLYSSELSGPLY